MMDTSTAARAVTGHLVGANVRFQRVTTDSRALRAGDLFVALKGERFDGHDFVPQALAQGASAAIVAADRAGGLAGNLVTVTDPLAALARLAAYWRAQFTLPVVLVVGSNGKTTVKEMLAAILRAHFGDAHVLATQGNLNNAIGLPLTLLRLAPAHRAAVIELGMNHRGETRELAPVVAPTIALVNNAQREHQEFMRNVDEVAAEHADAIGALRPDGLAIVNADDAHAGVWMDAARAAGARVVTFGIDHAADVTARCVAHVDATAMTLTTPAGTAQVTLAVPGLHMARNALAATAAALGAGVTLDAVRTGLAGFHAVQGRLVAVRASTGALILDDSYNANPDSMRAAIDVLAVAPGTRWLVMGDMGEVGAAGPEFHREIGAYARARGIVRLYAAGTLARDAVAAFGADALHVSSVEELATTVARDAEGRAVARDAEGASVARDAEAQLTVLVKGSRFMRMERVVAALTGQVAQGTH